MRHRIVIFLAVVAAAAVFGAMATSTARADSSGSAADSAAIVTAGCDSAPVSQVFAPWLDPSWYAFLPNGGFEQGSTAWTLGGSAQIVGGNESFSVNDPGDTQSLELGSNGKATSDAICVTPDDPTLRLFVQNTGDPSSVLKVSVRYTALDGTKETEPVAYLTAGPDWQPSDLVPIVTTDLGAVLANGSTNVSFRFSASNDGGSWTIDDIYLDPFKTK